MNLRYTFAFLVLGGSLFFSSCKGDKKTTDQVTAKPIAPAKVPMVVADSAYDFIADQVAFGTRVPGTEGHIKTRDWIVNKMKSYGAEVEVQDFKASFLGKVDVPSYNIIAKINPDNPNRVALFAHWDTRLIAEKDVDQSMRDKPIDGAIDGASGVAGLLEIARLIQANPIDIGIDFVFFDAEDQGEGNDNWCIGSQYWSNSVKDEKIKPKFGILLDLIGAKGATYGMEGFSMQYAPDLVNKVWSLAAKMNKGNIFKVYAIGTITDDHYYVNSFARIPTIDIIQTSEQGDFGHYHHTHKDNINEVDKANLAAVIQVVTAVVYKTYDGTF